MAVEIRIFNQRTHWEAQGVERPKGQRYWSAGEEPPAEHFNWFFWATYMDIKDLAAFVQDQAGARFITPEMFTLAGDYTARLEVITDGVWPALAFPPGVFSTAVIPFRAFQPENSPHYVDLYWTTGVDNGGDVVWQLRWIEIADGEALSKGMSSVAQVIGPYPTAYTLRKTTFEISGLTQGRLVLLWLCRDGGHSADALDSDAYVVFMEVR